MPKPTAALTGGVWLASRWVLRMHSMGRQPVKRSAGARGRIHSLLRLLAARDEQLSRCGERVGELAAEVGRRIGMQGRDWASLRAAAPLHDLGMVALPQATPNKPGTLD